MKKLYNILVVDDDPLERNSIVELLQHEGYSVESASDGEIASRKLVHGFFDIVITDVKMPALTGFDLLKHVKQKHPETIVILITGCGQIEDAVTAIKLGAFDYIMKPFNDDTIRTLINQAIEQRVLQEHKLEGQTSVKSNCVIGQDKEIQKIMELVNNVAGSNVTVLITGESGTGKSLLAKAIHDSSTRRDKPFIEVPCGSIPDTLLESELFGHTRGSFTGAVREKPGRFELADGGTIFLDEIDNAKPLFQVKLLRVLQDKKFERLGGIKSITTNVRIIVATNSNLKNEIKKGNFRQDLYYRINVMPINIPPLRERRSDIKLLVDHFLYKYSNKYEKKDLRISEETMYRLQKYSWPGNVRELENTIQRAVVTVSGTCIDVRDISSVNNEYVSKIDTTEIVSLKKAMEKPEKEFIERTLNDFGWNKNKTAEVLDLNRTTLYKKMKKYGLLSKTVLKTFLL
jgi:DNA-binding NtrC family response regulator